MYLFIDTNVYLNFYHYSNDDLEELHKLSALISRNEIQLLLPQQTIDEFWRNHESKLYDAVSKFRSSKVDDQFPQICKVYDEYDEMRKAIASYNYAKNSLLARLEQDVEVGNLKADKVIQELFSIAKLIEITSEIVAAARLRFDLGNPPGKDGSYGDAVIWESLLSVVGSREDLCIVSDDKDFKSKSGNGKISPFLQREWEESDRGNLYFFERLSLFLRNKFPTIHVAIEADKELLIRELGESGSFAFTHRVVEKLAHYSEFSIAQANDILDATLSNEQVLWIINDDDVADLMKKIINSHGSQLDGDKLGQILGELNFDIEAKKREAE